MMVNSIDAIGFAVMECVDSSVELGPGRSRAQIL